MKNTTLAALGLTAILAFAGCKSTDIITYQELSILQEIKSGQELKSKPITSDKKYPNQIQKQIREEVEDFINSGKYNIISVETSYSYAFLVSAEIRYTATDNENKKIQVMFLHSNEAFWDNKQKEIKPKLEKIVNSGQYDIQDINKVILEERLVAAEVYYIKK